MQHLGVKHIVVSGHTSCGGVGAALGNQNLGLIDAWLLPLRSLRQRNAAELEAVGKEEASLRLAEMNVRAGVRVLREKSVVIEAMKQRGLVVHGVIYDVGTGELNELDTSESEEERIEREKAFSTTA